MCPNLEYDSRYLAGRNKEREEIPQSRQPVSNRASSVFLQNSNMKDQIEDIIFFRAGHTLYF